MVASPFPLSHTLITITTMRADIFTFPFLPSDFYDNYHNGQKHILQISVVTQNIQESRNVDSNSDYRGQFRK